MLDLLLVIRAKNLPSTNGLDSEAPPVQNQPWLQFPVGALSPAPKQ